ncbi:MAG: Flp family type IVb pilin [Alphaproteobacteria bacterium]
MGVLRSIRRCFATAIRNRDGANAIEYGLVMALVAVFIVAGVIAMSGELGDLFDGMGDCIEDPSACTAEVIKRGCTAAHQNCGD